MAATHQFTQTINIGAQRYDAGRQIDATEIPKGNFDSLTRLGVLVPVAPLRTPTPEPEPEPTPADETTGDDPEAAAEKEAAKAKAAAETAAAEAEAAKAKATTKKK